jgi:DNA ligase (NAD+)
MIEALRRAGVQLREAAPRAPEKDPFWDGKNVVFTGSLIAMTRQDAADLVAARGARVSSSVSKKTDYVVLGIDPGSKWEKAQALGVTIMTEQDFLQRLGMAADTGS